MKRTLQIILLLALFAPLAVAQPPATLLSLVSATPAPLSSVMVEAAAFDFEEVANDQVRLAVYPNPAAENPTVRFQLERSQGLVLDVFDLLGRRVSQQDLGYVPTGEHDVRLNIGGLPAGLYIVRLSGDAGARATVRLTRVVSA